MTIYTILLCNLQTYNAGLNFADIEEANNFFIQVQNKLKAKEQRREGEELI